MYRMRITNEYGTESLSLTHGGLRIVNYSWQPSKKQWRQNYTSSMFGPTALSVGYDQPLTETFTLAFSGTEARKREVINNLISMITRLTRWHDGDSTYEPLWLEWFTKGEISKRALLYTGMWQPESRPGSWPMLEDCVVIGQLSLTRHPLWEDSTFSTLSSLSGAISSLGGMQYIENYPGTAPGRIGMYYLLSAATTPLTKVWSGFRRKRAGWTGFEPVWECDEIATGGNGTIIDTDDTITDADYSCSNCNRLQIDFANHEDLTARAYVGLEDVESTASNWKNFRGRYLILCRCRIEDADHPAYLQMRYGHVNLDSPADSRVVGSEIIKIDKELYNLYELGEIEIPPASFTRDFLDTKYEGYESRNVAIFLWASGEADYSLYIDCLVLIPTDYFLYVGDTCLYTDGGTSYTTIVGTLPNERIAGSNLTSTFPNTWFTGQVTPEPKRWYMPEGDSLLVVAAQRADQHYFSCNPGDYVGTTDELFPYFVHYPRWLEYRGDDEDPTVS